MPVRILNKEFTDNFGNVLEYYQVNAGDKVTAVFTVDTAIKMTSINNPMQQNYNELSITSTQSFLDEGFRVGQTIQLKIYNQDGSTYSTDTAIITYLEDFLMNINQMFNAVNISASQTLEIICTSDVRESVEVFLNHVENGQNGTINSLIDNEATRVKFESIDALAVSGTQSGLIIGNQSGQFLISADIERIADAGTYNRSYELTFVFVNSGLYNDEWFESSGCLKLFARMDWATVSGEPYDRYQVLYNLDADTGYYNEPFNSGVVDSTLVQGIDELDYATASTFDVIVDGSLTDLAIGGAYVSIDDTYYKNKLQSQTTLTMLQETELYTISPKTSYTNPDGAGYTITVNSVGSVGTVRTVNLTFTPNAAFTTFMQEREEGDRQFFLWVKSGSINHLVFNNQMTETPPVGGALILEEEIAFVDHSQEPKDLDLQLTDEFDTEDDLAYYAEFEQDANEVLQFFKVRIEAYNTVTEQDFTLQETVFDFSSYPISSEGRYLIADTRLINPTLPTTSTKRSGYLSTTNAESSPGKYLFKVYYPFLLRWEYWLDQLNASVDFHPNQDKNWQRYSNSGDWVVRLELDLIKNDLSYTHSKNINIYNYNNEANITSDIDLIRELDATTITIIPEGELLRVKATHIKTSGDWDTDYTWGMIRCYPKDNSPAWISSSVIDYDNNTNNPLYPISGNKIVISYPSADTAVLECYFDSSRIDVTNGVSFSSKIKEGDEPVPADAKTTSPDDTPKTDTNGDYKTLAP